MFKHILGGAVIFGMAASAPPVHAQPACGERGKITTSLTERFGEAHVGGGLQSGTQMIEVWTSAETGSFTILLTRADGISCIVSTGKHWDHFQPETTPKGVAS